MPLYPPYEFRQVQGAGVATFATQDLPKGTIIMYEVKPILGLSTVRRHPFLIWERFCKLPHEDRAKYLSLCLTNTSMLKARADVMQMMDSELNQWTQDLEAVAKVAAIWSTNVFMLKDAIRRPVRRDNVEYVKPAYMLGVYNEQSRLNHMCTNNMVQVSAADGSQWMQALRNIKTGEELTCIYHPIDCENEDRQNGLEMDYGFRCGCPLCAMEVYITNSPNVRVQVPDKTLSSRKLMEMTLYFRRWFQSEVDGLNDEKKWSKGIKVQDAVRLSRIALNVLEQIAFAERMQPGFATASNNLEYWRHVVDDLETRYGKA